MAFDGALRKVVLLGQFRFFLHCLTGSCLSLVRLPIKRLHVSRADKSSCARASDTNGCKCIDFSLANDSGRVRVMQGITVTAGRAGGVKGRETSTLIYPCRVVFTLVNKNGPTDLQQFDESLSHRIRSMMTRVNRWLLSRSAGCERVRTGSEVEGHNKQPQ